MTEVFDVQNRINASWDNESCWFYWDYGDSDEGILRNESCEVLLYSRSRWENNQGLCSLLLWWNDAANWITIIITMNEIRKDIQWYEWLYEVSTLWEVFSHITEKYLQIAMSNWYQKVTLSKDGINRHIRVHRLIAEAFIPNPENKRTVNHKNWIKTDNRVENLEWTTHSENHRHAITTWLRLQCVKPVIMMDIEWNVLNRYDSTIDAARELWIHATNITKVCKWILKKTWWFKWKYE